MIVNKLIGLTIFIIFSYSLSGQNKLWLTNGKMKEIGEYKLGDKDFVVYKNNKGKIKSIEKFDVFAIIDQSEKELIVYVPDSADKESFTISEMKAFVQGQSDARMNFKSPLIAVGGAGVSGAAAVFVNPLYSPIISGAYCGLIGSTKTNDKKIIIPKDFENNNHYLLGYKKVAKQKRTRNAIFGSLIGLVAGFTTFVLINQ